MKIKLTQSEAVRIFNNTKKLNDVLQDEDAMQFYRDRLKIEDAFRAEDARIFDLMQDLQQLNAQETPDQKKLQSLQWELDKVSMTEKEFDITPIPFEKVKEAGQAKMEFFEIFAKLIQE